MQDHPVVVQIIEKDLRITIRDQAAIIGEIITMLLADRMKGTITEPPEMK